MAAGVPGPLLNLLILVYVSRSLRKHCLAFSVLYCPTELIQIEYYSLTAPFMIKESKYFYFLYIYFDYFNRIIQSLAVLSYLYRVHIILLKSVTQKKIFRTVSLGSFVGILHLVCFDFNLKSGVPSLDDCACDSVVLCCVAGLVLCEGWLATGLWGGRSRSVSGGGGRSTSTGDAADASGTGSGGSGGGGGGGSGNTHACPKCGRTYTLRSNLSRHMRLECGVERRYSCSYCHKRFSHAHHLRSHERSIHAQTAPNTPIKAIQTRPQDQLIKQETETSLQNTSEQQ
ncbi:uncharacterized protein LOC122246277 [Penaeus japonicus]|uniref:uncharacterized protein LOC122246277 n=1 Tax=Penaeus japonicus TaxID=27405 RepID=UPI001C713560|nr:uncharacterized protein LOC122246277 [Penaeus japonicus]